MHNHGSNCNHDLKYCSQCNVVYCEKCNSEWEQKQYFWGTIPNTSLGSPLVTYEYHNHNNINGGELPGGGGGSA